MLSIKNLTASIDGKTILNGLSLDLPSGEVHAIMGPNGAGKSTLSYVLTGRDGYEVTGGEVTLNGEDLLALSPSERAAKGVFLSFQYPIEIPGVPALTFLRTALNAQKKARGESEVAAPAFLKLIREKAGELKIDFEMLRRALNVGFSGGEKKRMEILQMAVLAPKLAILDETDSGLDIDALRIVAEGVNAMRAPDRSMLVITHYQRLLDHIRPDRVHVLAAGRIVASGGPELAHQLEREGYDKYAAVPRMSLARAIETGDLAELPSRRDEDWHWTDLRGLIREMPAPAARGEVWAPGVFSQLPADDRLEIVNGRGADERVLAGTGPTLELRLIADGPGASSAHLRLIVEPDTQAAVLFETHEASSAEALASIDLQIDIAAGASLERVVIVETEAGAVLVSMARVNLGAGARFSQTVIVDGSRRQRTETRVDHPGQGASARLDGVYLLADQRHADITTVVTHSGMHGTTDQLTKGVVRDQGRGVFQGRIVVRPGADKTDARMGHHALVLSDRAEVDAKPELEIFADDVACAHGNTVGALDEDALFYAEQRGIPEDAARAMLTEAFVGEVVDRIEHEGARDVVRAWVAERLR